jgi:hypothetical protein
MSSIRKCRSPKCGWLWLKKGKVWDGPYWPMGTVCREAGHRVIPLSFGDYCGCAARPRSRRDVKENYADCWPLEKL